MSPQPAHDLQRFVDAQAATYPQALAELRAGSKRSHWMWFVFPQVTGLGRSETARFYAIGGRAEAAAYLAHPALGPRLLECCAVLAGLPETASAHGVFGPVDAMKLRSCLTLFESVSGAVSGEASGEASGEPVFGALLDRYFDGERDQATLDRLQPE